MYYQDNWNWIDYALIAWLVTFGLMSINYFGSHIDKLAFF